MRTEVKCLAESWVLGAVDKDLLLKTCLPEEVDEALEYAKLYNNERWRYMLGLSIAQKYNIVEKYNKLYHDLHLSAKDALGDEFTEEYINLLIKYNICIK